MRNWLRRGLDVALAFLARVVLRVFFREIEVVGRERVRGGSPVLVVANHVNALVDPLLILAFLGLHPRILAKSTLWRHPVVAPLLVLAGAVPVYRRQDGMDTSRNLAAFRHARRVLARGGAVLLFPEGTSHNQPYRLPLKTGAARIALDTEWRHGPLGLRIVPVGLVYEAKGEFRSRVLISIGEPIDPAPERHRYPHDGRAAARALTQLIATGLDAVARYDQAPRGPDLAEADPPRTRRALLAAPMLVGVVLNWLPYRLPGWIAGRLSRAPDDPATYKLLAALLTFPLAWALETLAAALTGGAGAAAAVALLAPLTGLAALRYWERPAQVPGSDRGVPGSGAGPTSARRR